MLAITLFIRKLDHPHFVKFYGTALVNENDAIKAVLVMELCKGNLKSHFESHPISVPGVSANPKHVLQACKWVIEICSALDYIHNERVVHRDLKLKKILVRNREKPSHVCFTNLSLRKLRNTETKSYSLAYVGGRGGGIHKAHFYLFPEAIC